MTNEKITIKNDFSKHMEELTRSTEQYTKKLILKDIEIALIQEQLSPNAIKIIDTDGNLCCKRWVFMDFLRQVIND